MLPYISVIVVLIEQFQTVIPDKVTCGTDSSNLATKDVIFQMLLTNKLVVMTLNSTDALLFYTNIYIVNCFTSIPKEISLISLLFSIFTKTASIQNKLHKNVYVVAFTKSSRLLIV